MEFIFYIIFPVDLLPKERTKEGTEANRSAEFSNESKTREK